MCITEMKALESLLKISKSVFTKTPQNVTKAKDINKQLTKNDLYIHISIKLYIHIYKKTLY